MNASELLETQIGGVIVREVRRFQDARGWLVELFRDDELPTDLQPQMAYVSQTEPGVARGPHEHVAQSDLFVFLGPGDFELFLWDHRPDSPHFGRRERWLAGESRPLAVIVPPGVVHAYRNVSSYPGWVFNAPNRLYAGPGRQSAVDEIRWEQRDDNPFPLER